MGNRRLRKTAPGFGDPEQREAVERAFAALDRPSQEDTPRVTGMPAEPPQKTTLNATQTAAVAPPTRVSARRPSMHPRPSRSSIPPADAKREKRERPPLDVEVRYSSGRAPQADPRFLELWTRNNIYVLDGQMRCISVRSSQGEKPQPEHPFLGARLVGGQLNSGEGVELSYPLPRPGSTAVFETRRGNKPNFTRTSEVLRIVLHMNVARVTNEALAHTWADLSEPRR